MKFIMRHFRRLPAPPVNAIWEEIERRGIGFSSYCFDHGGRTYIVHLKYDRDGIDCDVKGEGRTFDEALNEAWSRWPRS